MPISKGEKQPTAAPSYDSYRVQQEPAGHDNPEIIVVAFISWHLSAVLLLALRPIQQGGNHTWLFTV